MSRPGRVRKATGGDRRGTVQAGPLVSCPACGKDVSPRAPACPGCGEPMASSVETAYGGAINVKDPVHILGIAICVVLLWFAFA